MPRVSLIILSWNALELLKKCFPSVVATDYPDLEIIYADNASTDGSPDWITQHFPSVRVLRYTKNHLFCRGNNKAIQQATGKYLVLLNNDVETPPDWLAPLVAQAEADESIGALQPKILQYDKRDHFGYGGAAGGFLDRIGYSFTRGHILGTMEQDRGQYDDVCDLDYAGGCAMFLRREALEKTGLLDEHFQMHMEEIDLCWRLRAHGFRIVSEPSSYVYHVRGDAGFNYTSWRLYFNIRNSLWMLYKNLPAHRFMTLLVQKAAIEGALAAGLLLRGKPRSTAAILRGYWDAHWQKRRLQRNRNQRYVPPTYRANFLWDYYVLRRHTFSALPKRKFRRRQ